MKPICVIPARAGSKRVPGKNMRDLGGKPLVCWIAEAALMSNIFEKVFVSTDDPKISVEMIERCYDSRLVVLPRGNRLSGDDVRAEEVFKDAVERQKIENEIVCMAMPTAPFTQPQDLAAAYGVMMNEGLAAVALCVETEYRTQRTLYDAGEPWGYEPVSGEGWEDIDKQSQDLPKTYRPTYGGMFVRTKTLLEFTSYYAHHGQQGIHEVERWSGRDIDTEWDFAEAEAWLMNRRPG